REIVAPEGARVPVNQVIAYLAAPGEAVVPTRRPPATAAPGETPASTAPRPRPRATASIPTQPRPPSAVPPSSRPKAMPRYRAPVERSERERFVWMYRAMRRIRAFDERIVVLFSAGRIAGALHSYVGEEAVAAGVGVNLRSDDYLVSTHRGHGHL